MRLRNAALALLVSASAFVGACDMIEDPFAPDEDETPTPGSSPTPTVQPTPENTPVTTTDGDIVTIDWGTMALDAGQSPRFQFTVPAGAISIDFMALGAAADQSKIFGFFSLVGPSNIVINNQGTGPARQAVAEGAMSFSVPSDDSATTAVETGDWEFAVFAFDPAADDFVTSDPQVLVKVRTAPGGTVPNGEIDLNLIIVTGHGLTAAADCVNGSALFDGLGYAAGLFQGGMGNPDGLTILNVACSELAQGPSDFRDIGGQDELSDLLETSGSLPDARLNLFIVDSFSGQLANAAGVAGSVPIPMGVNGTRRSGVAVAYSGNMATLGETVAHEIGHSLGLYHTTEFNAAQNGFDPISDSPQCPSLGGSYGGSGCADDVNVMFPQLTGTMQGFTAGQLTVIKPTVHVRRENVVAFATQVSPIYRGDPRVPAWEGPPIECRNGVLTRLP